MIRANQKYERLLVPKKACAFLFNEAAVAVGDLLCLTAPAFFMLSYTLVLFVLRVIPSELSIAPVA